MNAERHKALRFLFGGDGMSWREALGLRLPAPLAQTLRALPAQEAEGLEEIRLYAGRRAAFVIGGQRRETDVTVEPAQMDGLLAALCGHALYRCEEQLAQGFIPLPGGHRAGVCGRMTREAGGVWRMGGVTSVCIRVCRSVPGASAPIRHLLLDASSAPRRVLLLGPPGCGKTTVLRDAALYLAEARGLRVAVADEREELFSGAPCALDVLAGMDKAQAIMLLLRGMAPQVIVTDEIGRAADVRALLDASRCGVGLIASAHAGGVQDARRRPELRRMMEAGAFDRVILLARHGRVQAVCDTSGDEVKEGEHGQLGCGGDGDDRDQRGGLSALGRGEATGALGARDAPLPAAHERHHSL